MIGTDFVIDQIQGAKKAAVKMYVTDKEMSDVMNNFIDAQTEYTKKAASETMTLYSELTAVTIKTLQNASKFDYFKFGEGIMKAYQGYNSNKK